MGVVNELDNDLRSILPGEWFTFAEGRDWNALREVQQSVGSQAIVRALGRCGWIAPHWDVEHGGRGLPESDAALAIAHLDSLAVPRIPRGTGFVLAAPAIRQFASEETKRRFLPKIVTGEEMWAQLFSEPGAGSDLASLACRAVRDGGEWVASGQKVWTTLGHEADIGMLLARTDPDVPKNNGITYFAVDLRAPGVELRPLIQMTGEHEFNQVFLSDVRIPDSWRISPVNEGWAASNASLAAERITLSGQGAGGPQKRSILGGKTTDEVLALAHDRGLTPVQRQRLVEAWINAKTLGLTVGRMRGPAGSITKVMKAKSNQELQCLALEILGADVIGWDGGVKSEYARYVREFLRTRANSIEGGTSEIQRNIIGEQVLGLPREPNPWAGQPWTQVPRN